MRSPLTHCDNSRDLIRTSSGLGNDDHRLFQFQRPNYATQLLILWFVAIILEGIPNLGREKWMLSILYLLKAPLITTCFNKVVLLSCTFSIGLAVQYLSLSSAVRFMARAVICCSLSFVSDHRSTTVIQIGCKTLFRQMRDDEEAMHTQHLDSWLIDPALDSFLIFCDLTGLEPKCYLLLRRFYAIWTMNDVAAHIYAIITSDGSWSWC